MAEDTLGAAIATDPFDHRGMVQRIGIDDEARKQLGQRAQRRVIRDIGGGEDKGGLLGVQIRKLGLQRLVIDRCARDVARAARTRAGGLQRLFHRVEHDRVLAHAQIVVAAPDGDLLRGAVWPGPDRVGELTAPPLDIDEGPLPPFVMQTGQGCIKRAVVVHWLSPFRVGSGLSSGT